MEILIVTFLSFTLRFIFITSPSSDKDLNLWMIRKYGKNRFADHRVYDSIIPGSLCYAWFNHWLYSLFTNKHDIKAALIINIIYDIILVAIAYYITNQLIVDKSAFLLNLSPGFWVSLIFSTSPILFPITARLKGIGARTFGNLVVGIYFIALYFSLNHNFLYFPILLAMLFLSIVSSQFATQAIILFTLLISIYYLDPFPILLNILGIIVIYKSNVWGAKSTLKERLDHYLWYFKNQSSFTAINQRNLFKDILLLPYYLLTKRNQLAIAIFNNNTILIAFYSVLPLFFLMFNPDWLLNRFDNPLDEFMLLATISSVALFLLTSTRYFLFLGQAERYFEYALYPIIYLFFSFILENGLHQAPLLILIFNISVIAIIFVRSNQAEYEQELVERRGQNFNDIKSALESSDTKKNILVLPTKKAFDFSNNVKNDLLFYYYPGILADSGGYQYMNEDEEELYHVKPSSEILKDKYKFDLVVVDKSSLSNYWHEIYSKALPKNGFKRIKTNQEFELYERN